MCGSSTATITACSGNSSRRIRKQQVDESENQLPLPKDHDHGNAARVLVTGSCSFCSGKAFGRAIRTVQSYCRLLIEVLVGPGDGGILEVTVKLQIGR